MPDRSWLRRGSWAPARGTWVPVLVVVQVITLTQAVLRGADYVRSGGRVGPDLATLTAWWPLWVWGLIFSGFGLLALVSIAGRWGRPLGVGHCGVALAYASTSLALFEYAAVESWWRIAAGVVMAAAGVMIAKYDPGHDRLSFWVRVAALLVIIGGGLGVVDGIGHGFRTATGLASGAAVHGVLGIAILRARYRQTIRSERTPAP